MTLITKSDLKLRGWTDSLIKRFYPLPHSTARNPHHKSAAPVCLYDLNNVTDIESGEEFIAMMEKAQKKSETAKTCANQVLSTKRKNTFNRVEENLALYFPNISKTQLLNHAIKHYNERLIYDERNWYKEEARQHSDSDFLYRITFNYVRHELTNYEHLLYELTGLVGKYEAREYLHKMIGEKMVERYGFRYDEVKEDKLSVTQHYNLVNK